ncbi:hypothetical protein LZ32DRAFT_622428 [Colletotrichum eremochloae]|nr:hypothetical protein LZ32DRAFT_622428 [Colletotrichum eremochloae]
MPTDRSPRRAQNRSTRPSTVVPEMLNEPDTSGGKSLGYVRLKVTNDALTSEKVSELLAKFRELKPIVTDDSSFHLLEGATSYLIDQINPGNSSGDGGDRGFQSYLRTV